NGRDRGANAWSSRKKSQPSGGLKTRPCPSQRAHSGVLAGTKIAKFEQTNDHLFSKQLVRFENRQLPEAFALRCELDVGQ
ncbi:MAG: hypothetical protein WCB75_16170, partial [Pseudolabrys sp.]